MKSELGAALVEHAEKLAVAYPRKILGLHEHGARVALWRILELAAVDVLPHRLVGVLVNAAAVGLLAREDAVLERSLRLELDQALLELVLGHVAVAARAAKLQHQREALVGERLL